jgi:hypothetical protein
MLTAVERVLILKGADLLKDVGPRHLVGLAQAAREVEMDVGDTLYRENDPADALYMVVTGRVRLSTNGRTFSVVGAGEAFGTWALVDDSSRGQRADCLEEGLLLALHRDEFYDVAAGDLTLLQNVVRALARRLRALVSERPEEARVEAEGMEKTETPVAPDEIDRAAPPPPDAGPPPAGGAALAAAALGQPAPDPEAVPDPADRPAERRPAADGE